MKPLLTMILLLAAGSCFSQSGITVKKPNVRSKLSIIKKRPLPDTIYNDLKHDTTYGTVKIDLGMNGFMEGKAMLVKTDLLEVHGTKPPSTVIKGDVAYISGYIKVIYTTHLCYIFMLSQWKLVDREYTFKPY